MRVLSSSGSLLSSAPLSGNVPAGLREIPRFGRVSLETQNTITVYLRNRGNYGALHFKELQLNGDDAFTLVSYGLASSNGVSLKNVKKLDAEVQDYTALNVTTEDIVNRGFTDLALTFKYTPTVEAKHSTTVSVFHDGAESETTFQLESEGVGAIAAFSAGSQSDLAEKEATLPPSTFHQVGSANTLTTSRNFYLWNKAKFHTFAVSQIKITGEDAHAFEVSAYKYNPKPLEASNSLNTPELAQKSISDILNFEVKFTPFKQGEHHAQLEVYHDAQNGETPLILPLKASGHWDVAIADSAPSVLIKGIRTLGPYAVNSLLPVSGDYGFINYDSIEIDGSDELSFSRVGLSASSASSALKEVQSPTGNQTSLNLTGEPFQKKGYRFLVGTYVLSPQTLGTHQAKVRINHDGNALGFSELSVTGTVAREKKIVVNTASRVMSFRDAYSLESIMGEHDFGRVGQGAASAILPIYGHTSGGIAEKLHVSRYEIDSPHFKVVSTSSRGTYTYSTSYSCTKTDSSGKPYTSTCSRLNCDERNGEVKTLAPNHNGQLNWNSGINVNASLCSGSTYSSLILNVQYQPQEPGEHNAILRIYNDGADEGFHEIPLKGSSFRNVTADFGTITQFGTVGVTDTPINRVIALNARGTDGHITYRGFEVIGPPSIVINSVKGSTSVKNPSQLAAQSFELVGGNVNPKGQPEGASGLELNLDFMPTTEGEHSALIRVFHDGNEKGYSEFTIGGTVVRNIVMSIVPETNLGTTVVSSAGAILPRTIRLNAAGQGGQVTYTGVTVSGSELIQLESVSGRGASILNESKAKGISFNIKGASVNPTQGPLGLAGLDLRFSVKPEYSGEHIAEITVYHDGNVEGFTKFIVKATVR